MGSCVSINASIIVYKWKKLLALHALRSWSPFFVPDILFNIIHSLFVLSVLFIFSAIYSVDVIFNQVILLFSIIISILIASLNVYIPSSVSSLFMLQQDVSCWSQCNCSCSSLIPLPCFSWTCI